MYAHQVIEDIISHKLKLWWDDNDISNELRWQLMKETEEKIPLIEKAQKFHGGIADDLVMIMKKDHVVFADSHFDRLRLPYPLMWVDFNDNDNNKYAVLVGNANGIPDLLYCSFFLKHHLHNAFMVPSANMTVSLGKSIFSRTEPFILSKIELSRKNNCMPNNLFDENLGYVLVDTYSTLTDQMNQKLCDILRLLETFLIMINCKNVIPEKIKAPDKLNKKRIRNGKPSIFDYYILNVFKPGIKQNYHPGQIPLSHYRVHLCRGHYKEYTAEHPLLGRHTGLYWWQPHVRGQNKEGVVVKDYNVHAA